MPETVTVSINGSPVSVPRGATISAAMLTAAQPCRISVSGQPRTALCGMGICFECRAIVNGVAHARTCQMLCKDGMQVETQR
jgi:D-hydroxyproline dehydrogenase subunit gamma